MGVFSKEPALITSPSFWPGLPCLPCRRFDLRALCQLLKMTSQTLGSVCSVDLELCAPEFDVVYRTLKPFRPTSVPSSHGPQLLARHARTLIKKNKREHSLHVFLHETRRHSHGSMQSGDLIAHAASLQSAIMGRPRSFDKMDAVDPENGLVRSPHPTCTAGTRARARNTVSVVNISL